MPYNIQRDGNQYKVVATETGKVVGTHPSKEKAQAQLGALYSNVKDVKKCMTCGCDDLGNDHHYISDTEKCAYCIDKGQGPCWDGYEYAGTKEKDGKTVPNCIPVKKESAGAGRISGGVGFKLEYNVPDCLGGYAITKAGTGQVIGCYTTKEHAEEAMKAIAVNEPVVKGDQTKQDEQEGIGSLSFWNGSFAPVIGSQMQDMRYNSTYNTPPQKDGNPSVGYGNSSGKNGRSNQ
jgi:hypothetical protein